ncbi:MAG: hypothetical protein WD875_04595 [Pirellulales bacterium]
MHFLARAASFTGLLPRWLRGRGSLADLRRRMVDAGERLLLGGRIGLAAGRRERGGCAAGRRMAMLTAVAGSVATITAVTAISVAAVVGQVVYSLA